MLDKPVLGIGLGAQILSLAAEGGVEPAPLTFTVGEAKRVSEGALSGFLPVSFPNVVFMRDRPVPPPYAQVLAVDEFDRPAVFQIGPSALGFTGHPGLRRAMIEDLIMELDEIPESSAASLEHLGDVSDLVEDALVPIMTGIVRLTAWMG